jgi:hypothetical protein
MLMTESSTLTLVKTVVITSKSYLATPNDLVNQVNTHLWPNLGQRHGQIQDKPLLLLNPPSTFAAFSKFHSNTSKSANIKVVRLSEGYTFHNWRHLRFWVEIGENLSQTQYSLLWHPRFLFNLNSRSKLLAVVKSRSTWVFTSKTSPTNPNDPIDQVDTHVWSSLGQIHGQTLLNPRDLECLPELLPRSQNFT